jgi:hypothetical protein
MDGVQMIRPGPPIQHLDYGDYVTVPHPSIACKTRPPMALHGLCDSLLVSRNVLAEVFA